MYSIHTHTQYKHVEYIHRQFYTLMKKLVKDVIFSCLKLSAVHFLFDDDHIHISHHMH